MRRWLWLIPVVGLFVVGGIGLFRARPPAELGRPAPAFELATVDDPDIQIALADLRGRPAVLNFWASWCGPCRDEAPALASAAEEAGDAVTFLGITILDGRSDAQAFMEEFEVPYRSVMDPRGVTSDRYGVTGVPETVFLDAEGTVVGSFVGAIASEQLDGLMDDLLALEPGGTLDITGRGETRPVP